MTQAGETFQSEFGKAGVDLDVSALRAFCSGFSLTNCLLTPKLAMAHFGNNWRIVLFDDSEAEGRQFFDVTIGQPPAYFHLIIAR